MCFWSRLIQLLQGDDILVVFVTIQLETEFFLPSYKILQPKILIAIKITIDILLMVIDMCYYYSCDQITVFEGYINCSR